MSAPGTRPGSIVLSSDILCIILFNRPVQMASAVPVFLAGFNADGLKPGSSLDIEDVGNFEGSRDKLIMKVAKVTGDTIEAVEEIDLLFELHAAKIYYGRHRDLMVILYMNTWDELSAGDVKTISTTIPYVMPFRPLEANNCREEVGLVWLGNSLIGDSVPEKLL
jgi:hypothetical protein